MTSDVSPYTPATTANKNISGNKTTSASWTSHPALSTDAKHARLGSDSTTTTPATESTGPWYSGSSSASHPASATMSVFSTKPAPPHALNVSNLASSEANAPAQKFQPKSPGGSKLGSFFGWGGVASPASSTTTFSDNPYSPLPTPSPPRTDRFPTPTANASKPTTRNPPKSIDIPKANAAAESYFSNAPRLPPLATPSSPIQINEMEKELQEISAELAASIRREMDLEDLVERLQTEAQNPTTAGRRTSDYFSDSGTSSVKYGDADSKQEELDRLIRKTEQDKAQMRLELTDKVQDERSRRKHLEAQIRGLEGKASNVRTSPIALDLANVTQVDLASMNSLDASGRLKDLEATCEDLRRRLSEERQVKENFEDLLTALKGELLSSHNERDNLRDEIVPQLRARVEGLEAQAAQHEKLNYEQSKMQQELQSLKEENMSLSSSQKRQSKFDSIVEMEGPISRRASGGLTRSASLALGGMNRSSRPPSLSRSTSVKVTESREALADRVRDIELQRDSLHRALKSLLDRQEHQNRENSKKIRQLELERDRALSNSPRRLAYDKEVATLREEINTLRRRAEDAIEQKWQCEKGLGGLKMDLDRSEQEIGSLRSLLQANDILIPASTRQSAGSRPDSARVSSESLEAAYRKLQAEYTASLERVKALEQSGPRDEDTEEAMKQLELSLSNALSERDHAKEEANTFRQQAQSGNLGRETALAEELRGSAQRVEELAGQVRQQLASNSLLRERLASTIERGEREQKANASKIMLMQNKLKALEDQLMAAQQASEETISRHEEEVRSLKDNHNVQLQRSAEGTRSPRLFAGKSPLSPMFANSGKSPRIATTTSGTAKSVAEDSNMALLKQRVVALESALAEADRQMEEVVGRMNIAQIEVMNLQNEREDAVRETRALQKRLEEEKKKATRGIFG